MLQEEKEQIKKGLTAEWASETSAMEEPKEMLGTQPMGTGMFRILWGTLRLLLEVTVILSFVLRVRFDTWLPGGLRSTQEWL